jgi:serine/threonine protein kinase
MKERLSDVSQAAVCGRYMLDHVLGRGGMGVVYLAHDLKHGREVALKIIPKDKLSWEGVRSFHREIRLTARLQHPHILPLLDSGEFQGAPYYVTPFVAGGSLRDQLNRRGRFSLKETVAMLDAVGGALAYAHTNQVIHCDIKPENILLSGRHPIVADFGIFRALAEPLEGAQLVDRAAVTPGYGSPEQLLGFSSIDERTDVYSLGCVAFELLTGQVPSVQADRGELPRNVRGVLTKATADGENNRYPSVEKFTKAFARAAGFSARGEPLLRRAWRRIRARTRLARRRSSGAEGHRPEAISLGPVSAGTF